ncbi:hypothetical protein ACO02O_05067 [Dirofilaria immitis]
MTYTLVFVFVFLWASVIPQSMEKSNQIEIPIMELNRYKRWTRLEPSVRFFDKRWTRLEPSLVKLRYAILLIFSRMKIKRLSLLFSYPNTNSTIDLLDFSFLNPLI